MGAKLSFVPKLVVFDFDGVLTDNRVLVLEDGREGVFCSRADGLAFDMLRKAKIPVLILSTERNKVVSARARKLKVAVLQGLSNKSEALTSYCKQKKLPISRVLFIGNDLNDFEVMRKVGASACPRDAHVKIKSEAHFVLRALGGKGVAREVVERLLGLDYFRL